MSRLESWPWQMGSHVPESACLPSAQAEAVNSTWGERTRQGASAGAGVLSGTAAWLLQRARRMSSAGGGPQDPAPPEETSRTSSDSASVLPSISDMCGTVNAPCLVSRGFSAFHYVASPKTHFELPIGGIIIAHDVEHAFNA